MSALGGPKQTGGIQPPTGTGLVVSIVLIIIALALAFFLVQMAGLIALIGIIIGGVLIGFGVHFVPVGGAPAAMGQAPGIATGVAMLAAGAGLAGLFGGAWAVPLGIPVALAGGAVGGGLLMAITCTMVNVIYVFGMGIPAASGKVAKDPITGDTFPEYKSQGTEGHGLPFISWVGGVIGGALGGFGGTLIYIELLEVYQAQLPALLGATVEQIAPVAVSLAGIFAIGMFLMNAVLAAYNITGTIEGPHDPKFKRFPRAVIAAAAASAVAGIFAIALSGLLGVF
ncbi:MAG: Tetrahydromethanopterin S-methyltransferase subunit D [Euryarchaeota archaeon ADurb.Bin009]|jgi:tetrahydromethanopterin S-methyltransferase subunit D|uniref:tetrahydromethanopterin S-methyltransferase subunit D n=1 Tax=Methanoculleus sp. TaxID=90427 RepID=UPI0009CFEAB9|nr:tetrahydromethanopterin S-methyltransferase subunit D [Methanoculleus sp.]OQC71353.1 MAG: Tetrahydromethanopterin S-methyltransferase subunit D [Euryarchaeota archaeon ADurb.Bin009]MBP7144867.1 tetrahydromethanopterin S-methyltransferase subunit D [Methanoculleus sp.]HNT07787.1 tetrahydromethanopterin S-methyltransferase subunit D [Methanoculleus sp.]HNV38241.1 tetrahydromethanopterin S-methyltransferase subunit D [Methanoculleus sp.]HOC84471.1 tetrahydromethanopterin S-methyltransferase su